MHPAVARTASTGASLEARGRVAVVVKRGAVQSGSGTCGTRGSAAPDRGLAVAAVEDAARLVLHPLRAAGAALRRAREGPGNATGGDTGLPAVLRCDLDRGVAALALARVDPARIAPARILGCAGGGDGHQRHGREEQRSGERSHARPCSRNARTLTRLPADG